jgi:ubiquitin carboxyl-terminal hydrolase MINDY-1/2
MRVYRYNVRTYSYDDVLTGNILILRGNIEILPPDRTSVSYDHLAQLVGEFLLTSCQDVDISAALSIMPVTRSMSYLSLVRVASSARYPEGMDLNPLFTGVSSFRPAGSGGELQLFQFAGIELVHGWLVDPSTPEYPILSRMQDYDTCVNLIAEVDHLSHGQFLQSEDEPSSSSSGPTHHRQSSLKPDEQQKIEDGMDPFSF